jgi:glycosyltransferase involved in cell wall biosynthesis
VIRGLVLGKPLVVSDVGWFAELPDGVALRVPVDEWETRTLEAALALLCEPHARDALGRAALDYVEREHSLDTVADRYAEALELAAGGARADDAVLGEVARAAAEVGLDETDELAARLGEVGLGR